MKKTTLSFGIVAITTLAFAGCGNDDNNGPAAASGNQQAATKVLLADLAPLNPNLTTTRNQKGTSIVSITGDKVDILVNASGLDSSMTHMGHIHKGDRCPSTTADDVNGDGVLDVIEGVPAYGPILVAFGANVSSLADAQRGGSPLADATGMVNYLGTGSFSSLVTDLHDRADLPAATGVGKLAPNEAFVPENGVIVIHGILASSALPATVATVTGLTPQESVPVLCGRLRLQSSAAIPSPATIPSLSP